MAYTPGVARVCQAIATDKHKVNTLTIKHNSVAVVSDGRQSSVLATSAAEAAMPVMEGKSDVVQGVCRHRRLPDCLQTQDPDEIVLAGEMDLQLVRRHQSRRHQCARCFDIEQRLKRELDIPVFHDDQHGTAIVVLAATLNALKIVKKSLSQIRIVIAALGQRAWRAQKFCRQPGTQHHRLRPQGNHWQETSAETRPEQDVARAEQQPR